jgi:hypothetical protein
VKFEICLLLALIVFGIFKTRRSVKCSRSAEERFFAIRASAFTWVISILLASAFIFLPGKMRILFLLPTFLIITSLIKFWRNGRIRLQTEQHGRVDFERMKRVN